MLENRIDLKLVLVLFNVVCCVSGSHLRPNFVVHLRLTIGWFTERTADNSGKVITVGLHVFNCFQLLSAFRLVSKMGEAMFTNVNKTEERNNNV